MRRCMAPDALVAAPNVAARLAAAQVDPASACRRALLAARRGRQWRRVVEPVEVAAARHGLIMPDAGEGRSRAALHASRVVAGSALAVALQAGGPGPRETP